MLYYRPLWLKFDKLKRTPPSHPRNTMVRGRANRLRGDPYHVYINFICTKLALARRPLTTIHTGIYQYSSLLFAMESCVDDPRVSLAFLVSGRKHFQAGSHRYAVVLRQSTRLLYQASHTGRQQIYRAKAAFDSTYLEKEACVYERRCLEEEISSCIGTRYAFTSLIEQPDETHIEEQLNKELGLREAASRKSKKWFCGVCPAPGTARKTPKFGRSRTAALHNV